MIEERKKIIRNLLKTSIDYAKTRGSNIVNMNFEISDVEYIIETIDKDRKSKGGEL